MIVIKYNKETSEKVKVKYPAIWGKSVPNLDKNIVFYEIKELERPTYNPDQYTVKEKYNLTEIKGEFLNICEVEYFLVEVSKDIVITNLNNSFGVWIDGVYPLYKRINDTDEVTDEGNIRKAKRYVGVKTDKNQCSQHDDQFDSLYIFTFAVSGNESQYK